MTTCKSPPCGKQFTPRSKHPRDYCSRKCQTREAVRRWRDRRKHLEYDSLEAVTTWAADVMEEQ